MKPSDETTDAIIDTFPGITDFKIMVVKPCPFCGSTNIRIITKEYKASGHKFYHAWCHDCESQSGPNYTKEEAIEQWNTRASQ